MRQASGAGGGDRPQVAWCRDAARGGRRAVWLDIHRDVHAPADAEAFAGWCQRHGVGLAFPCVNHCTGFMTYASDVAPRSRATERWDPTAALLEACHRAGIGVHAWVCIGCWGANLADAGAISARGPRLLQERHPNWFAMNHDGRRLRVAEGMQFDFLNTCSPAVCEFHVRLCEELLGRYPFDGYHLDYIRNHFRLPAFQTQAKEAFGGGAAELEVRLEGSERMSFDEPTLRAFAQDSGVEILQAGPDLAARTRWLYRKDAGDARREAWYAWKSAQVTKLVRTVGDAVRRHGRALSAAVFSGYPWCGQEVAQRWPAWVDERLLDLVVPMDYGVTFEPYAAHLRRQTDALQVAPRPAIPMLSGLDHFSLFPGLSPAEAQRLLSRYEETARACGRAGICLYDYRGFRAVLPAA
jgi:uncharacterized lipoprotein YddW (UPF0748 family)